MDPKAKRTPREMRENADREAARHMQKAREVKFKSQVYDVSCALTHYPEFAPSVIQHLTSVGVDWDKAGCPQAAAAAVKHEPGDLATPTKMAKPVDDMCSMTSPCRSSLGVDGSDGTASLAAGAEDAEVQMDMPDPLPSCYTEVRLLSVKVMKHYLKRSEPAVFSDFAIRALQPMGKKTVPKSVMLEIWEYVYGMAPEEAIAAAWHVKGSFEKHLNSVNMARGRLSRDMVLPPNYADVGIYKLRRNEGEAFLSSRLFPMEVRVPDCLLMNVDIATVHIQVNYSERSALVADASGALRRQASLMMLENQRTSPAEQGSASVTQPKVPMAADGPELAPAVPDKSPTAASVVPAGGPLTPKAEEENAENGVDGSLLHASLLSQATYAPPIPEELQKLLKDRGSHLMKQPPSELASELGVPVTSVKSEKGAEPAPASAAPAKARGRKAAPKEEPKEEPLAVEKRRKT